MTISNLSFGALLKQLRKQAGMTQRDLAAVLNYSDSLISSLEKEQCQPDIKAVIERFIPALGLQDEPIIAATLIEQAALARGERPPAAITRQRNTQTGVQAEYTAKPKQLPAQPTELIGRSTEINQLCNRLLGHSGRLLTLLGPPGIGKTALGLAVAARLQPHYRDGVVFVPLAPISDPMLMASTILATVGSADHSPPKSKLIEFLRRKTMLLLLDNLEQITEAAPLVAELLVECPKLSILATSRERLHLRAEQRYKVPPLDPATAVELFVQRAQAVDSDFALTLPNQPTVEAICQRLDYLPLAIELCAAQIDLLSLPQLLAQLQTRPLDLLVDGARDLPPDHRTLRAAIGRSYALLHETERLLFRCLALFAGGFDLDAVETVSGWEPGAGTHTLSSTLHALIGKSLVRVETLPNGEQRFLLLETIREFALEQVRLHGEEALLRQRHYATYLQRFRTGDRHLRGAMAAVWLERLSLEQDNLRIAMHWALAEARYADATWLLVAVTWYCFTRGQWYEKSQWLTHLLPYRHLLEPDLRFMILLDVVSIMRGVEAFQPFDRWRDELFELSKICSDNSQHQSLWYFSATYAPDPRQAATDFERAIGFARAACEAPGIGPEFCLLADPDFLLGVSISTYTGDLIEFGELARAKPLLTECIEIFQARGCRYEMTNCLGHWGRLAFLQGDLIQAQTLIQEAATGAALFGYPLMLSYWQSFLAIVTLYNGAIAEASRLLNENLRLCLDVQDKFCLTRVCIYLAETALWQDELAQAEQWLKQSLIYYTEPQQIRIAQVERLWIAARLATAQQHSLRATTLFGIADQIHSQLHYAIGGPMRALADAALATVQATLEPAAFTEAFAAGQQILLEEAFATLLP